MNPEDPVADAASPLDDDDQDDVHGHAYVPPDERPGGRPRPGEGHLEESQDSDS